MSKIGETHAATTGYGPGATSGTVTEPAPVVGSKRPSSPIGRCVRSSANVMTNVCDRNPAAMSSFCAMAPTANTVRTHDTYP